MARWEQQGSPGHSGLSLLVLSLGAGKWCCKSCCWSFPPRGTAGPGRSPLGGGAGQRDTQPAAQGPLPHFWENRCVLLC